MFDYYQPTRLHFGENRLEDVGKICIPYGKKALLVTTADGVLTSLYQRIKMLLEKEGIEIIHFDKVKPNPHVDIVEEGKEWIKRDPVDFVLAVGGGSSIDTAKAIAFTNGLERIDWDEIFHKFQSPFEHYDAYTGRELPIISMPTTSGTGSQVTQAAVLSRQDEKITFFHPLLFSKECILDPLLTTTLPAHISAATGFDAFTHAFESYINPKASMYSKQDSLKAMEMIIQNLKKVLDHPMELSYRSNMMLADTLAGRALANGGAAAPHPLSEIIGGVIHIPHGEALAIVFPAFIKHFEAKHSAQFKEIAALFGGKDLYLEIIKFLEVLQLDKKISDYQISEKEYEAILTSPILKHLPFGSEEQLQKIIKESY